VLYGAERNITAKPVGFLDPEAQQVRYDPGCLDAAIPTPEADQDRIAIFQCCDGLRDDLAARRRFFTGHDVSRGFQLLARAIERPSGITAPDAKAAGLLELVCPCVKGTIMRPLSVVQPANRAESRRRLNRAKGWLLAT
jgi:hypothetical protein